MSYYKVTFESDSIEGLKAIPGSFSGSGKVATTSSTSETPVLPPPQQANENADAFSDVVQAPPVAGGAGTGLGSSDADAIDPPPLQVADSASKNSGGGSEFPPPLKN